MDFDKLRQRKPEPVLGSRTTYEEAAMSVALNLAEFCDEYYFYPDMVMDAARKARDEIKRLRTMEVTDFLVIGAFRYAVGRMTYAVYEFTHWLIPRWPHLSRNVRELIHRELEEAFAKDARDRTENRLIYALGHDCDRACWQMVRDLWAAEPRISKEPQ